MNAQSPPPRLAYKIPEAAEALGVGRTTIYRMIADGELETTTIRGLQRVPADVLQRAIDANRKTCRRKPTPDEP